MKFIRYILYIILIPIVLVILFLLVATLADYSPEEREVIFESSSPDTIQTNEKVDILTWNIGYCGLGKEMDFFYDGGTKVRATKENTLLNLDAITKFLVNNDTIDMLLLQEVDVHSKRTYYLNEVTEISRALKYPNYFFANNYKVFFLPIPLSEPLGKIMSGLLSLSKFEPYLVERYDFPGNYSWPKKLLMLDRCFMVERYILSNQKKLLVINTHNSAFDGGLLKKHEMAYLKEFIEKEYASDNYILAGGDWNQNPPGFNSSSFNSESGYKNFVLASIPSDFIAWNWTFDNTHPTNRALTTPYNPESTATTILDFFLCSPNVLAKQVKTVNLNFENSDHQPVIITFVLE